MKEIQIKVLYKYESAKEFEIYDLFPGLSKSKYNFIPSENPDFILFSQTGSSKFFDYNCVRIVMEPEQYKPDFNICDYAISDSPIQFDDRHFRMPYLAYPSRRNDWLDAKKKCSEIFTREDLSNKDIFCNFIYSNGSADEMRKILFNLLSKYKFVHAGGVLFNNIGYRIGGGINDYDEKIKYQSRSKFTLAVENTRSPGYTTEKILHAFMARTIPIYWGDPMINEIFNKEAFIDCNNYNSITDVINKVKEIDNNDEEYLNMVNSPVFNEKFNPQQYEERLNIFLENIFNQKPQDAFRRARVLHSVYHENYLRVGRKRFERKIYIKVKMFTLLKKLGIENNKMYQQLYNKYKKYTHIS